MGKIIYFKEKSKKSSKKGKLHKNIAGFISLIASICTISGVTVWGLLEYISEKDNIPFQNEENIENETDWQALAEQYNNEGLELHNLGEYEKAIEQYNRVIDMEADIEDIDVCFFNRGQAYYKLKDYQKAISDYTMAIEINAKAKYYSNRALAYEKIGDIENMALDNARVFTSMIK